MSYFLSSTGTLLVFCYCCSVAQSCRTLCQPRGLQPTRLLCPWGFPGKITGVGYSFFLQGIFLTQGSNLHLRVSCTAGGFFTTAPLEKPQLFRTESQQIAALFLLEHFLSDLAIWVLHREAKILEAHVFPWASV